MPKQMQEINVNYKMVATSDAR